MKNESKKSNQQFNFNQLLDWLFIVVTFAAFLFLGSMMFYYVLSVFSLLLGDGALTAAYFIATVGSAFLGAQAIGSLTKDQYPKVCCVVTALGAVYLLYCAVMGGSLHAQGISLLCGGLVCAAAAVRYYRNGRFL